MYSYRCRRTFGLSCSTALGMLAAMSSLASLAHAAEPAFNGLFYATVATIIPVLFLALAVQGRTSENLVKVTMNADKRRRRGTWKYLGGTSRSPGRWLRPPQLSPPTPR